MRDKGIIIVNTGNGKGKTTAAFGQALRAAGQGLRVCIIQFIKGKWPTGEAKSLTKFENQIELHTTGTGFTWEAETKEKVILAAQSGWKLASDKINSDCYDLVVLDELTYLVNYGFIDEKTVLDVISNRPPRLHLVVTGRDASPGLLAAADIVTEMREIKHHFGTGNRALKGIEF